MIVGPWPLTSGAQRLPPMKTTVMGSGSSLLMESRAWVGWPLMSLMPKISDEGNEVETFTARFAEVEGCSASASSACLIISGLGIGGLLGDYILGYDSQGLQ